MLNKVPKPTLKKYLKLTASAVIAVEVIGLAVSYGFWRKLNTDRDFRLYMHQNYDWALESYYQIGERLGGIKTRELDQQVWTEEGKV